MSGLTYEIKVPNENDEELSVEFDETRVRLATVVSFKLPNSRIYLTHAEFEALFDLYYKYKQMLKLKEPV